MPNQTTFSWILAGLLPFFCAMTSHETIIWATALFAGAIIIGNRGLLYWLLLAWVAFLIDPAANILAIVASGYFITYSSKNLRINLARSLSTIAIAMIMVTFPITPFFNLGLLLIVFGLAVFQYKTAREKKA
ncbi:MAG: hypothetical protein GXP22_10755 [Gammaproteobacteria bacterium]|nr:hypothetical protein [Gammaproteobacteria bacterium]